MHLSTDYKHHSLILIHKEKEKKKKIHTVDQNINYTHLKRKKKNCLLWIKNNYLRCMFFSLNGAGGEKKWEQKGLIDEEWRYVIFFSFFILINVKGKEKKSAMNKREEEMKKKKKVNMCERSISFFSFPLDLLFSHSIVSRRKKNALGLIIRKHYYQLAKKKKSGNFLDASFLYSS